MYFTSFTNVYVFHEFSNVFVYISRIFECFYYTKKFFKKSVYSFTNNRKVPKVSGRLLLKLAALGALIFGGRLLLDTK